MSRSVIKPKKTIYLDYAATTPLSTAVYATMKPYMLGTYGNPSSMHTLGRRAYDALTQARTNIATLLDVIPSEIIFTGSGTESNNLALFGLARAHKKYGNHIIVSKIEHKAVLMAAHKLEQEGFRVTYLPVNNNGIVRIEDILSALRKDTILISIMYANNEIGTIEPVQEIAETIRTHYKDTFCPLIHTDACQAVGLLPVGPKTLGVDAMSINSSKIYGPKGVGLLYLESGISITPHTVGGDQEYQRRAGTENVSLIVGFAEALKLTIADIDTNSRKMIELNAYFCNLLKDLIPNIIFNGHKSKRLFNNVHICIPDIEGESLVLMLDEYGICCSTGSACSSLDLSPSHVLQAIGLDDNIIHGSLRFSFGKQTTKKDLKYTAYTLKDVVDQLRRITASTIYTKQSI